MPKPNDERLIAYLDGELGETERAEMAHWLESDAALRERAARLGESAALLRAAFDEVLREPVPERLVEAAHGPAAAAPAPAAVVDLAAAREQRGARTSAPSRWWIAPAAAAAIAGIAIGIGLARSVLPEPEQVAANTAAAKSNSFVDNIRGYYLRYANVGPSESASFDKLPQNFRVPDLKPWGLEFRGARFLMVEGHDAMQLLYSTDNKALGPVTVIVGNATGPDTPVPSFGTSGAVNVVSWRSHGHTYAVAGTVNINYLWNIHNDLSYQFDGI
jgi:anti-sigma factor RsiW